MTLLVITAVDREAEAIGRLDDTVVVAGGVGRTNAAACTTEMVITRGPFSLVMSAGIAGALPESGLEVGDAVVASRCVYAEEGLVTGDGIVGVDSMGLSLGDFAGNGVPVDERAVERLAASFPVGPIATVATCSGTDAAAADVARRTGALAEAMEGAAVVHAARRRQLGAIELRTISNHAGERSRQRWDIDRALETLASAIRVVRELL